MGVQIIFEPGGDQVQWWVSLSREVIEYSGGCL